MTNQMSVLSNKVNMVLDDNLRMKPEVHIYKHMISSKGLVNTSDIAHDYNMSGTALNRFLHKHRVIYPKGHTWHFYKKYQGKGYGRHPSESFHHNQMMSKPLKWTFQGQVFIHDFLSHMALVSEINRTTFTYFRNRSY